MSETFHGFPDRPDAAGSRACMAAVPMRVA